MPASGFVQIAASGETLYALDADGNVWGLVSRALDGDPKRVKRVWTRVTSEREEK